MQVNKKNLKILNYKKNQKYTYIYIYHKYTKKKNFINRFRKKIASKHNFTNKHFLPFKKK